MSQQMFETKPRWPGAPPICLYENLPAFQDEAQLTAFNATCGESSILRKWLCNKCLHWHFFRKPIAPSGSSSGNERAFTMPIPRFEQR